MIIIPAKLYLRIIFLLNFYFLLFLIEAKAQDTLGLPDEYDIIFDDITNENAGSYLIDKINRLIDEPININTCSESELYDLPFIPVSVIKKIINFRTGNGKIGSFDELRMILDNEQLNLIGRYLKFSRGENVQIIFSSSSAGILEKSKGYESVFLGSPLKSVNKLSVGYENLSVGFITDKDPGEKMFSDFYSGYIEYIYGNSKFIAGDFIPNFGYGLCISKPFSLFKGNLLGGFDGGGGNPISPYFSSTESGFMRGFAITSQFESFNLTLFYSNNKSDANTDSLGNVKTILMEEIHKTEVDILKRDKLNEAIFGGRIAYSNMNYHAGINMYFSEFNREILPREYYSFNGKAASAISIDVNSSLKNISFFGEAAITNKNAAAALFGLYLFPVNEIELSFIYRYYPENYINLHANAFSESGTNNENGIFLRIGLKPIPNLKIDAYYDMFKFPYRGYFIPLPSSGADASCLVEYSFIKNHKLICKYHFKDKEDIFSFKDEQNRDLKAIMPVKRQNIKFEFISYPAPSLRLRCRLETVEYKIPQKNTTERGIFLSQDFRFYLMNSLNISARYMFFDTDSYNSAIYEYESEVENVYGNYALTGKGKKFYIIIESKFLDIFKISLKYSNTSYRNIKSLGSGNDTITGNSINRISINFGFILN